MKFADFASFLQWEFGVSWWVGRKIVHEWNIFQKLCQKSKILEFPEFYCIWTTGIWGRTGRGMCGLSSSCIFLIFCYILQRGRVLLRFQKLHQFAQIKELGLGQWKIILNSRKLVLNPLEMAGFINKYTGFYYKSSGIVTEFLTNHVLNMRICTQILYKSWNN